MHHHLRVERKKALVSSSKIWHISITQPHRLKTNVVLLCGTQIQECVREHAVRSPFIDSNQMPMGLLRTSANALSGSVTSLNYVITAGSIFDMHRISDKPISDALL